MYPDRLLTLQVGLDFRTFQIERHLARHRKQLRRQTRCNFDLAAQLNRNAFDEVRMEGIKNRIFGEHAMNFRCGEKRKSLLLAQGQQPCNVVDIAIGEQDRPQGGFAQVTRMQRRGFEHLVPNIGRRIQNRPLGAIGAEGERRLGLRGYRSGTRQIAILAPAVPLWQTTTGSRPKNMRAKRQCNSPRAEISEQIAVVLLAITVRAVHVDLHPAFNFADNRF
mmetsp:Transcript_6386/g.10122  ORF Transcript_6386/g.10122 Transcript_6386/m.10122 type:complete len:221 (+) Transcript_6386:132-794(+)